MFNLWYFCSTAQTAVFRWLYNLSLAYYDEQTWLGALQTATHNGFIMAFVFIAGISCAFTNSNFKRAVKMAEEGKLNTVKPSSYDGSVPLEKMGPMTLEEKAAYLEARTIYLETLVEAKKKWLSELLGKPVSSIRVID
jgi:hypothetical protein